MGLFPKRKKGALEKALYGLAKMQATTSSKKKAPTDSTPKRYFLDVETEGNTYPLGTKDLQGVVTEYSNGAKICHWFSTEESRQRLIDDAGLINGILDESSKLSGHPFELITQLQFTVLNVLEPGKSAWGFCRAEYNPVTPNGNVSKTPMKAYLETHQAIEKGAISAIIHYGEDGSIKKIVVREYAEEFDVYQVNVSSVRGKLVIKSITNQDSQSTNSFVLYKA